MAREKSPLPGWDPYLVRYWRDVHHRLITYSSDFLRGQLPANLRARIEERVVLESEEWAVESRTYMPDVALIEWPHAREGGVAVAVEEQVAEPIKVSIHPEPLVEGYIEIRDLSSGGRLVTTIEFTSPTNKTAGKGADGFRKKQRDCLKARVSVVEIDLIRGGEHILSVPLEKLAEDQRDPPCVCVAQAWKPNEFLFYPISIQERLPAIRIPLRQSDKQVRLDIQAVFDQAYLNGDYGADIDYSRDPKVPLGLQNLNGFRRNCGRKV